VLNVLIHLIRDPRGYAHFHRIAFGPSIDPNVERNPFGQSNTSTANIGFAVAQAFKKSGSDLALEKCLLFFINLTSHHYPNTLALLNWNLVFFYFLLHFLNVVFSFVTFSCSKRFITDFLLFVKLVFEFCQSITSFIVFLLSFWFQLPSFVL
jgi:hypothetical protein